MPVPHLRRTSQASKFVFPLSLLSYCHTFNNINMSTKVDPGRSSMEDSPPSGEDEIVEPDQGNGVCNSSISPDTQLTQYAFTVLSHIISQLRPGADLSRVVLPTFILEPRSMLERITKCVHTPQLQAGKLGATC